MIRAIAIFFEAALLAALAYVVLNGVRLMLHDLGISQKYRRFLAYAFFGAGFLLVMFFIIHLSTFYPKA